MSHADWGDLVEPLRARGILVRHTSGPFLWFRDGGAAARRGDLWFMFARDPSTRDLQCWVADRDDDSPDSRVCTLGNLLVGVGRGSEQRTLHAAYDNGEALLMNTFAEIIVQNFGHSESDLQGWRDTVALEEDMIPLVERMFRTK